ncbi:MAG: protein-disulfide reductase DsbD [Pusillimonas sp.]|nr:protein-disulfide reductase DsbD [Pusillimonas sp.]
MQQISTRFVVALVAAFFVWLGLLGSSLAQSPEDFLPPDEAFSLSVAQQNGQVQVHYRIAPEYYMYRDRFQFTVGEQTLAPQLQTFPPGLVKYDPTFDKNMEVYYGQVTVVLDLPQGLPSPAKLIITSQGCADAGLCYPPQTEQLSLNTQGGVYQISGDAVVDQVPPPLQTVVDPAKPALSAGAAGSQAGNAANVGVIGQLNDVGLAEYLASANIWTIVLACFVLGILLTFTPCVLPMVPILMAVIAGTHKGEQKPARWRGLLLAATYVFGVSLLYTVLGVAAGLAGAGLAAWLQNPWVLSVFAALLALLALAMFNVYSVQTPLAIQNALGAYLQRIPGGHYSGAFLMGLVSALIVGPCVAAPLAGVLLFISQTGDAAVGAAALFALAWGQGVLLLALGAGSGALLPKAGTWMEGFKILFGILLLATAWWMLNSVLPDWLMLLGWVVLTLWSAILLGALRQGCSGLVACFGKALGLLLAGWALLMMVGMAMGTYSVLQPLGGLGAAGIAANVGTAGAGAVPNAKPQFVKVRSVQELDVILASANSPVLLDFYADWCVSCIEMERFTFTNPAVAQSMRQFVLVQADVTKNTDEDRALLERFRLFGPPGIIFFDANGRMLDSPRVIGFMRAEPFNNALQQVLTQHGSSQRSAAQPSRSLRGEASWLTQQDAARR